MTGVELFTIPALSAGGAATAVTLADVAVAGGTLLSAGGALSSASAQRKAANFQAAQMAQQAGQERASAQRAALVERRRADLATSRARAVAGASGAGGASDPTVANILGDIDAEGEYRALTALYQGEERATGLTTGAAAKRYEGAAAQRAGYLGAAGTVGQGAYLLGGKASTLLGDGKSLLDKFG